MQSNRETDENYKGVVAVLNQKLRVIKGACGLQWIVQNRSTPAVWRSIAFCATNEGLLLRLPANGHGCNPEAWRVIEGLADSYARTYHAPEAA